MKLKSILSIAVLLSLVTTVGYSQIFGVKAGVNLAKMKAKDDFEDYTSDLSNSVGFHVAGTVEFPISSVLSIEPGLMFQTKGFVYKESDAGYEYKASINAYYLDVPVLVKAGYNFSESVRAYVTAGPYAGFGLSGKTKYEEDYMGVTDKDEEDIEWRSDDDDNLRRFDFGFTFGGGVMYDQILLEITYDLGVANISSYTDDGMKLANRVLRFSLGYKFGAARAK